MKTVLIVFLGSGIGGVARYIVQNVVAGSSPFIFPVGTFTVNVAGCFLIGLFYALGEKGNLLSPEWRIALTTGFCGGFTTFSTFAFENMNLLRTGDYIYFVLYIFLSILLGIVGVFLGIACIKYI
jgi:fluoride exporter